MKQRISAKRRLERYKAETPSVYLFHIDALPAAKTLAAVHLRVPGPSQEGHLPRPENFLTQLIAERGRQMLCVTSDVASGKINEDVSHWLRK